MSKIQTIVVAFNGTEPTDRLITSIKALVEASRCATGNTCKISVISEEELYRVAASTITLAPQPSPRSIEQQAIEAAVVYIGEKFADSLVGRNKSIPVFQARLSACLTHAKMYGTDDELLNAVNILLTHNGKIPASLAKKYGFSQTVLDSIDTANRTTFQF